MFRRKRGYNRLKDVLKRKKLLDQWYDFEARAIEKLLRDWCEVNRIAIVDNRHTGAREAKSPDQPSPLGGAIRVSA
jgi:hypothetical protein